MRRLRPSLYKKPHIPVYFGGESEEGRALAARMADVFLVNGRPAKEVGKVIEDMKLRAEAHGRNLRFGIAAFVICREKRSCDRGRSSTGLTTCVMCRSKVMMQKSHNLRNQRKSIVGSAATVEQMRVWVGTPETNCREDARVFGGWGRN